MNITDVDCDSDGQLTVSARGGAEEVKTLKLLGVVGLEPQASSFEESIYVQGQGKLSSGVKFTVGVSGAPVPENCHVEKVQQIYTEHVLICDLTGEKV
jgi:hypothetical protein